jgi:hypothetical protein
LNTDTVEEKPKKFELDFDFYEEFDPKEIDLEIKYPKLDKWQTIGFHRSIGKELWEFFFEIIYTGLWIFVIGYLVPLLQPFPEIQGYQSVGMALFATVFFGFDLGTNFPFSRYIAENRIKDPLKMLEYIRFFVWYQMITGLIQVTILVSIVLYSLINSQYAYLSWIILIVVAKQWPGMIGVFRMALEGNQEFGKATALSWIQQIVFEYPLKIGMILYGKWYGEQHPELGIIMAMAIFSIIGYYIDDVIFLFINAYYFGQTLKPFGYSIGDALIPQVRPEIFKKTFKYGTQSTGIPFMLSIFGTIQMLWFLNMIPGYITWIVLISVGSGFTGLMGNYGFPLTQSFAESYSNDKKKLAEFCVSYYFKWKYLFIILVGSIVVALLPFYELTLNQYKGLQYYHLAIIFVVPAVINKLIEPILGIPGQIMWGAEHITQSNVIGIFETFLNLGVNYILLFVVEAQYWGIPGIMLLLVFTNIIPRTIIFIVRWIYVNKKIIKIRVFPIGSFVLPTLASLPIFLLSYVWINFVFDPMVAMIGYEISMIISLALAVTFLLFLIFFPLTGILGVWDDYMIYTFEKAVALSGPSLFIFKTALKSMKLGVKIGRKIGTHSKWRIPWEDAHREADELMQIRSEQMMKTAKKDEK